MSKRPTLNPHNIVRVLFFIMSLIYTRIYLYDVDHKYYSKQLPL